MHTAPTGEPHAGRDGKGGLCCCIRTPTHGRFPHGGNASSRSLSCAPFTTGTLTGRCSLERTTTTTILGMDFHHNVCSPGHCLSSADAYSPLYTIGTRFVGFSAVSSEFPTTHSWLCSVAS